VEPGRLAWDDGQVAAARRALRHPTLCVMPAQLRDGGTLGVLVAAERLRRAGGLVVHLSRDAAAVRRDAQRMAQALAAEAAARVSAVGPSMAAAKRRAAWSGSWLVCTTPDRALADAHGGIAPLERCSLLVVDRAERAVGSPVVGDLLRELRRARPRALVLGLSTAGADRRRTASIMESLGLKQLEVLEGGPAAPAAEVIRVELPGEYQAVSAPLESELGERLARLAARGLMPMADPRAVTTQALIEAGERARPARGRDMVGSAEPLRHQQAQAMLLLQALELLEAHGAPLAAGFLTRLAADPGASPAERALAASPSMGQAHAAALAAAARVPPKAQRIRTLVRDTFQAAAGARVTVIVRYRETAAELARLLAAPPPLGVGRAVTQGLDAQAPILIVTAAAADASALSRAQLVIYHDSASFAMGPPGGHAAGGRPPRVVVLVAAGAREEAALAGGGRSGGPAPARAASAARTPPPGSQVLIDDFTGARGLRGPR
jgi:ERCC4-related helicase